MNNQIKTYQTNLAIEQEVHERTVKALNQEPLKVDLIDFYNRNHHGYLINDSAEHQDVNSGIRIAIAAFTILLLVAVAWYYSTDINYIMQGGKP